ncbi:MAG: hypothetical protein ABSG96_03440, partial [Terracidiphilus sp.]
LSPKEFSPQFADHFPFAEHNQERSSKKPPAEKLIADEKQAIPSEKLVPISGFSRNQLKTNTLRSNSSISTP